MYLDGEDVCEVENTCPANRTSKQEKPNVAIIHIKEYARLLHQQFQNRSETQQEFICP